MDGSGSGLIKPGSGSANKPRSIRIGNIGICRRSAALLFLIICFLGHFEAAALKQLESTHTGLEGQIIVDIGSFHKYRYSNRCGFTRPCLRFFKKIALQDIVF